MSAQRVAVVGVGAVGGVFAAHLSAVHEVVACSRRPFDQYRIDSADLPFEGPATVATSPDELGWDGPADAVFVGLKAQQTEGGAGWFRHLCGPETLVVVMQNGLEHRERLGPLVGAAAVVPCVVYCGGELVAPGHVRHDRQALLIVDDDEHGRRAAALVEGTPLTIKPSADRTTAAWTKLGINSVVNGLTGLTGRPMGVVAEPGVDAVAEALLTECWTVARAEGAELELHGIPKLLSQMASHAEGRTSMLHDREAGRPTEHDAIHGAILRRAAEYDIETPVTRMVHDLLAAASRGAEPVAG